MIIPSCSIWFDPSCVLQVKFPDPIESTDSLFFEKEKKAQIYYAQGIVLHKVCPTLLLYIYHILIIIIPKICHPL